MHTITKEMWTETGHRLINYRGKCAHLHGHSYLWQVELEAVRLDTTGFVVDFKDLKALMGRVIDEFYDHALILHKDDPLVAKCGKFSTIYDFLAPTNDPNEEPALRIVRWNPTAENMAMHTCRMLERKLDEHIGKTRMAALGMRIAEVRVHETRTSVARYVNMHARASQAVDKSFGTLGEYLDKVRP